MAGANLIYGPGMLESGITFDFGQLVMDNEFIRMIKYLINGIPVNDETLSVDVINEIGAFNDFLSHDTTFKNMKAQSRSELIDRKIREEWQKAGKTDIRERATEKARRILNTHKPKALPADVLAEIRSIIEQTEEELGVDRNAILPLKM